MVTQEKPDNPQDAAKPPTAGTALTRPSETPAVAPGENAGDSTPPQHADDTAGHFDTTPPETPETGQPEPPSADAAPAESAADADESSAAADADEASPAPLAAPARRSRFTLKKILLVSSAAVVVFSLTLGAIALTSWINRLRRAANDIFASGILLNQSKAPAPETLRPEDIAAMQYDALMAKGDRAAAVNDYSEAARCFGTAAQRGNAGLPATLLAQERLSRMLLELGQSDDALQISLTLRSVSWPGDELWRSALLTSIDALGDQARWQDMLNDLNLLRANSGRYPDAPAMNAWIDYRKAIGGMLRCTLSLPGDTLPDEYKIAASAGTTSRRQSRESDALPVFGRSPYDCRPLTRNDIQVRSGPYGDGTIIAEMRVPDPSAVRAPKSRPGDEQPLLTVRAHGASLGRTLAEIEKTCGFSIQCLAPYDWSVNAGLEPMPPDEAINIIAGSLGLDAVRNGTSFVVKPAAQGRDASRFADPYLRTAAQLASLQELNNFRDRHPTSPQRAEVEYAAARLLLGQRQTAPALTAIAALSAEFPRDPWTVLGHYVAARTQADAGDWAEAAKEISQVTDAQRNRALQQWAFFWLGQCQAKQENYHDALVAFREALIEAPVSGEAFTDGPATPEILLDIAQCMEKTDCAPLDIEQRYTEVKTRFPNSEYARQADHRLARMAFDAGDLTKAARRYEWYLGVYPLADEESFTAGFELMQIYMQMGNFEKAVLLGEEVRAAQNSAFARNTGPLVAVVRAIVPAPGSHDLIPLLLDACDKARMPETALRVIGDVCGADDWTLLARKAGFLVDLGNYAAAQPTLDEVEKKSKDNDALRLAKLARARMMLANKQAQAGLDLCRDLAMNGKPCPVQTDALLIMGQFYEGQKQYDRAAHAYSGECCAATPAPGAATPPAAPAKGARP